MEKKAKRQRGNNISAVVSSYVLIITLNEMS